MLLSTRAVRLAGAVLLLALLTSVKVDGRQDLPGETPPTVDLPASELPDSSSFMMRIVRLRHREANQILPLLASLSRTSGSILSTGGSKLVLRDYSSNIRKMVEVIEEFDSAPGEPPTQPPGLRPSEPQPVPVPVPAPGNGSAGREGRTVR